MATFGRFAAGDDTPFETYEGDEMIQEKEFVKIFKRDGARDRQVVAIYLDKGQSVREITRSR
jgi:hypothetical protein